MPGDRGNTKRQLSHGPGPVRHSRPLCVRASPASRESERTGPANAQGEVSAKVGRRNNGQIRESDRFRRLVHWGECGNLLHQLGN